MLNLYRLIIFSAILPLAPAQDFFPLAQGNFWKYSDFNGIESHTISVGVPRFVNGKVYYSVSGYGPGTMLVRREANGDLVAFHEEDYREEPLVQFDAMRPPISTRLSGCVQQSSASAKRVPFANPAGREGTALEVNYQSRSCADVGLENELYMENIGLVQRSYTTIAGLRQMTLTSARIGRLTFAFAPSASTRLVLPSSRLRLPEDGAAAVSLRARLWISTFDTLPVRLQFRSTQRYDLALRNGEGEVVYNWSADKLFLPEETFLELSGDRTFDIEALLPPSIKPGDYTVEAWLATEAGRGFAASAGIRILAPDVFEFPGVGL